MKGGRAKGDGDRAADIFDSWRRSPRAPARYPLTLDSLVQWRTSAHVAKANSLSGWATQSGGGSAAGQGELPRPALSGTRLPAP